MYLRDWEIQNHPSQRGYNNYPSMFKVVAFQPDNPQDVRLESLTYGLRSRSGFPADNPQDVRLESSTYG